MYFAHPWYLLVAPALIAFVFWLLSRDFLPRDAFAQQRSGRGFVRALLLVTRTLIIVLLVAALAQPSIDKTSFSPGEPHITVLVDNSTSMSVFDQGSIPSFIDALKQKVPVTVRTIGQPMRSTLGTDTLSYVTQDENLLLVTDGQVTDGPSLGSVASFAAGMNATLNAAVLPVTHHDAAVTIEGPSKAVAGVDTDYTIMLSRTDDQPVHLRISVDGQVAYDGEYKQDTFVLKQPFIEGQHTITAKILDNDHFSQNNVFTHTVSVVRKPQVLYVTQKDSGLWKIVNSLYNATRVSSLPQNLSRYYAVILNDMPASTIDAARLGPYVLAGNGLVVVGGQHSYDQGGYHNSVLETLLPVRVGAGTRTPGGANIVIAMDFSQSTVHTTGLQTLEKSLGISVIKELNPSNYVGTLAFTYPSPNYGGSCSGACVITPVQELGNNKQSIIDKVSRLNITGGTSVSTGVQGAVKMLEGRSGSKNIILISDGITGPQDVQQAVAASKLLAAQGGRVFTVQVGSDPGGQAALQQIAAAGGGAYFKATQANRLSILFGKPVNISQGDAFDAVVLNQYHFITSDPNVQNMDAVLYGYNQVAPKPGSEELVTSNGGDPILTVWNYGVGRVASITGYNGPDLGALLSGTNSKLLSRTINWAIGDPQRKDSFQVAVQDGTVGAPLSVTVRSEQVPQGANLTFVPKSPQTYVATLTPNTTGVYTVLGAQYAVNYPAEYAGVGVSPALAQALNLSGGRVFPTSAVDAIITQVKTAQKLQRVEHVQIAWPLLLIALVLLVLEVSVRRVLALRRR